jgi:hypothetical protein
VYVVQRTKTDVEAALSPRRGGSRSRTATSCWIAPGYAASGPKGGLLTSSKRKRVRPLSTEAQNGP